MAPDEVGFGERGPEELEEGGAAAVQLGLGVPSPERVAGLGEVDDAGLGGHDLRRLAGLGQKVGAGEDGPQEGAVDERVLEPAQVEPSIRRSKRGTRAPAVPRRRTMEPLPYDSYPFGRSGHATTATWPFLAKSSTMGRGNVSTSPFFSL